MIYRFIGLVVYFNFVKGGFKITAFINHITTETHSHVVRECVYIET